MKLIRVFTSFMIFSGITLCSRVIVAQSNIALDPDSILTSHVSPWEDLNAINDGYDPERSTDKTGGAYGNWQSGSNSDWEWVEYNWDQLYNIYQSDVYWWTDNGGIQIPYNTYQEYWDVLANEWLIMPNVIGNGIEADQYNITTFDTILTNKIRIHAISTIATGILEWKVWGSVGEQIPTGSTCVIDQMLAKGTTSTITVIARDEENNPVMDYVFRLNVEIFEDLTSINEEYTINGIAYTSSQQGIELPATNDEGIVELDVSVPASIDPKDGIEIRTLFNNGFTQIGDTFSIVEPGLTPPILSADITDNDVDNNIEITFTEDIDWQNAITGILIDGTSLTESADYEITSGLLTLIPSGGNGLLTEAGSKSISVLAAGYEDATIEQDILTGAINAGKSTAETFLKLYLHTKTNIRAMARDQYENPIAGYVFKYDVSITNNNSETSEEYFLNDISVSTDLTDQLFTGTDENGEALLSIKIPDFVDEGDGLSVQVKLNDGTMIEPAISYVNDGTEKEIVLQSAVENHVDFSWEKTAQSDNFIVYWGSLITGEPTNPANGDLAFDPNEILETMEALLSYMTDSIGFIDNADERNMARYKHEVVMNETWSNGTFPGWAFGGWISDGKAGGMWIHPGATNGPAVLAHEFTHMCQAMIMTQYPGYGLNASYAGFFWESHANYIMAQYTNTYTGVQPERFINTSMLHFSTTRHYYQNQYFIDYVSDKYGADTVNLIWRMASPIFSHPLTSLRDSVLRYTQEDLNDDFGHYAMKNVTWDYKNGDLIRKAIRSVNEIYIGREYTILDSVRDGSGSYVVPKYLAPGDYGYNIIPLFPDDLASEISVDFTGYENEPAEGAGSRFGFVAVNSEGLPRYSSLYDAQSGSVSFSLDPADSAVFLIVTGAPQIHHNYGWSTGLPKEYRYPFSLKIEGALPAGHKPGYNSKKDEYEGADHVNGGGWVASTASVAETVYVGPNAQVLDDAVVSDNVRIEDYAIVNGTANVSGNAIIRGNSIVGNTSVIDDSVVVEKSARVYGTRLSDNAVVTGSALVYFSTISGDAIIKDLAYLYNVTLSGSVIIGGDAEEYTNCTKGTYLQMQTVRTSGCDGKINHKLNIDINPDWEIYHFPLGDVPTPPLSLAASNIAFNSVDLSWEGAEGNNEITGYYILQDDVVVQTVKSTTANVTDLDQNTSYKFSVKAKDYAGNVSEQSNEVQVTTDISGLITHYKEGIRIYPNPVCDELIIESEFIGEIAVTVYDCIGKQILNRSFSGITTIDRSDIPDNGLYLIHIRSSEGAFVEKVIFR